MTSSLSVLCVTRGESCILPLLRQMSESARHADAEFVLAYDGPEAFARIRHVGINPTRGCMVRSAGYIESTLDKALESVSGDYVLRLDDDESMSDAMIEWLYSREYEFAPHWKFPRAYLFRDENTCISNSPLWPDYQTRLSTREMSFGRIAIHCSSPFGFGQAAPGGVAILHHKLLVRSEQQRQEIIERYESIASGAGNNVKVFNLPETVLADRLALVPLTDLLSKSPPAITTSCRVRAVDFENQWLQDRAREMCLDVLPVSNGIGLVSTKRMHRKVWEFATIAQVYYDQFKGKSAKCLGFGCGKEPLPAWLASYTSSVVATDGPDDTANWTKTNQRSVNVIDLPWQGICQPEDIDRVEFRQVDMNAIPDDLLQGQFNFTWSCGSFEHIGGIDASLAFFCRQMQTLKPGGIAAHTTEFNPIDSDETLNEPNLCLFRERDLRRLESMLAAQGDHLWSLDLCPGETELDTIVDVPPYTSDIHLSIKIGNWTTTSVLLVAERGES